ncbi:MAG TPA: thiamine pyrophosphate-binding protein [Candidatus Brocadiia bacterium]|nr:thiamine pyrophosphate-binding protein [Candidatus Brocadiia bacterium]
MKLTGGQIVAEFLVREKVPYAIGIPGHGCLALVDAFRLQKKIGVIQPRSENAAVYMADGFYRACGRPLAVFTSIGPGACNTVIGLATAYVDSTPVLAFNGDTHTYMRGKGVLQEIERRRDSDFMSVVEPVTKRCWIAGAPKQLPSIMQRAFIEMMSGRRGPASILLPMDVQADCADVDPRLLRSGGQPVAPAAGDPDGIARAAQLLMSAKRPVIVAGGGINSAEAWDELRAVAEFCGAAVVTTLQGKGCFPENHPLSGLLSGSKGTLCGLTLTREADVILAVGCRFADESACSYRDGAAYSIPSAKLIHMDIEQEEIGKNYPAEVGIVADAKAGLGKLLDCLKAEYKAKNFKRGKHAARIAELRRKWDAFIAKWEDRSVKPMMITSLLKDLRAFLPQDAIVASSSGNTQAQLLQEFPFSLPRTNVTTAGFSTMGWAFPAALGAKLACPDRQVVAVMGDGDFSMTMGEMATAVQNNIPVVVVLANNAGWVSISDLQNAAYGEKHVYATRFNDRKGKAYTPNFAEIARGFGMHGERIESAGEVAPALERAFASGKPALVEAMCCQKFPRTGSPAHGWWDVPIPTYMPKLRRKYEKERSQEKLA